MRKVRRGSASTREAVGELFSRDPPVVELITASPVSFQQLFSASTHSINEQGRSRVLSVTNPDPSLRSSSSVSLLVPQSHLAENRLGRKDAVFEPLRLPLVTEGEILVVRDEAHLPERLARPEQSTAALGYYPILRDFTSCQRLDGHESRYPSFTTQPHQSNLTGKMDEPNRPSAKNGTPVRQEPPKKKLFQRSSKAPQLPDLSLPESPLLFSEAHPKSRKADMEARVVAFLNRTPVPSGKRLSNQAAQIFEKIKRKPVPFRPQQHLCTPSSSVILHPRLLPGVKPGASPLEYFEVYTLVPTCPSDPRPGLCSQLLPASELPYVVKYARREQFFKVEQAEWLAMAEEARILTERLAMVVAKLRGSLEVRF